MSRWWRRISLRSQLALVVAAVLSVLLATLGAVLCLSLRQFLYAQAERQLALAAKATEPALLPLSIKATSFDMAAPPSGGAAGATKDALPAVKGTVAMSEAVRDRLHVLVNTLTDGQTSALIVAPDGSELARGKRAYRSDTPAPPQLELATLDQLAAQAPPQTFIITKGGERYLAILVPFYDQDGALIAALQLASPTRAIDLVVQRFAWFAALSTGVTLLAGVGLCILASVRVLRPLHRIVDASREVADGNYTLRLRLPAGNEVGRLGAAFDHMVARTAEAFAAHQRFVADAAHELRTPLTAIGGSIEMLQIGAVDHQPEKRRRLLQRIGAEVDRLGRLANDLLLLTTLERQPPPVRTPIDLRPLLIDLIEQTRVVAPTLHIHAELPAALPVAGDPDQLHRVFLNILTNARTYTPAGGAITVSATPGAQITVQVSDTGIGIPPEALPHIWERLYRVEQSRSRAAGGSGLGLAIVQTIVTAHDGHVAATSAPGAGATISVTLPAAAAPLNHAAAPSANL
jgi:signal transduction histidine kinase